MRPHTAHIEEIVNMDATSPDRHHPRHDCPGVSDRSGALAGQLQLVYLDLQYIIHVAHVLTPPPKTCSVLSSKPPYMEQVHNNAGSPTSRPLHFQPPALQVSVSQSMLDVRSALPRGTSPGPLVRQRRPFPSLLFSSI